MKLNAVQALRVPSLLLAASLQVMPIVRAALPAAETATNVLAIIFRWGAGMAAALGGIQAVSGASTVITSPLSTNIVQGRPFTLRLTAAPNQAHYWTATGLPAGLNLSGTAGSTSWQITGTPTVTGTFNVALAAKEQQNSPASRTTTATLVINISPGLSPPTITTQPASQTATQGLSATFRVAASGAAPLRYQWRFQGANLAGQTATNLVLNPVTTANAGNYTVVITNVSGSITSAVATLTVIVPVVAPTITTPLVSQTITQGQNATFTVAADGTAPFSYFWLKGTSIIGGATGSSFTVTNAQIADGGSYSVIVSNAAGTATSAATLTVNPPPQTPYVITSPVSQSVLAGSPANFTGRAGGSSPLSYQWYFNATPLPGQTSTNCSIANVQSGNAGSYFFIATNTFGSVTSAVATLSLTISPGFTAQPQSRTNIVGGSVSFSVTVTSSVPVAYQWRKGAVNLANDGHFSGAQSNVLSIVNLLTNDAGNYSVVVTNVAGAVTSSVASLTVTSAPVVLAPLTVQISGSGSVNPNYHGQLLQVGSSYTMTATSGSGYAFSGWSGGVSATTPALTFVMQSNLVLRANFVSAQAEFVNGTYTGLFYESSAVSHLSSGTIKVTTTDAGAYSGTLVLFGRKYSLSGQFSQTGRATNTIPRGVQSTVTVELVLDPADEDQLSGLVTDGMWFAPLLADRAAFSAANPAPQAGNYTLILPGVPGATALPAGDGYGTVNVDASGRAQFKGALADGTKLTQSATLSKSGEWPFYTALYKNAGSILGWLVFTNTSGSDLSGLLGWSRGQQPSARYYLSGFGFTTSAIGSKYAPPSDNEDRVLNFSRGRVWIADGNRPRSVTNQVSLSDDNRVNNRSDNPLTLALNPATGLFKGRLADPATGRTVSINGVVLQKQNYGSGFFLGTNRSGRVYFGP